jgi:hypothetical protein
MATKPTTVSLKHLTGTVDQAVKAALQRHQAKSTAPFILNPGILAGPLLDPATDVKVAQQIATEITAQVQAAQGGAQGAGAIAAPSLESGVLITRNHIICGFYPVPPWELNVEQ